MDRRIYLLTGCIGLVGANSLSLAPIAPSVSDDFATVTVTQVLWAAGGYGFGTALSALTLAPLVDRFGALPMLRFAMLALACSFLGSAVAPSLWALIAVQSLAGVAAGIAIPATYGLGSDVANKGEEARTMGTILTGWMLAMIFGVTCATVIADLLHWRLLFMAFAAIASVLTMLLFVMAVAGQSRKKATSPLSALSVPGMYRGMAVTLAYMLAFYGTYPFLAPNIVQHLNMSASATALPVLGYGIGFGASAILDKWLDRHPYSVTSQRIFLATGLSLAGLCLGAGSFAALVVFMGAYGVFNHAGLTLILNRLIALDPAKKGAILGIYAALTYAAVTIGAVGFAPIYSHTGYAGVAALAATLAFAMMFEARTVRNAPNAAPY